MCGEHLTKTCHSFAPSGSSPHVRGAPQKGRSVSASPRIIPACAGSTPQERSRTHPTGDHPRMCGEHCGSIHIYCHIKGSSPHVRGAPWPQLLSSRTTRIIPACAGSTTNPRVREPVHRDHPRMCGEHPTPGHPPVDVHGSSPHVRGAQHSGKSGRVLSGIIPACAGSTFYSRKGRWH